jgi:VWFA-related protein
LADGPALARRLLLSVVDKSVVDKSVVDKSLVDKRRGEIFRGRIDMNRKKQLTSCLLALGLVAAAVPATAQPPDAEAPIFGEIVDVRVINLEVVVTDGKERIHGLRSEDFRLLVDGRETPIEYFTEVRGGRAAAEPSGAAVPALAPGEAVGTRYLVFIDDAFALPTHRNRVLRRLAEQLPLLGPDDHMAVVAYDGRQIDLLTSWTGSVPELERVFDAARERRAYGLFSKPRLAASGLGFDPFLTDSYYGHPFGFDAFSPFADPRYGVPGVGHAYAYRGSRAYSQAGQVIDAATSVLRGFARPPGRKVMLLLTGGWPVAADSGFSANVEYGDYGTWAGEDRQLLRPLIDTANRLGYTLYPVDLSGLESHFGGAEFATSGEAAAASRLLAGREWIEEGALVQLARETGGRALLDAAAHRALERTVEDTRSYYWLGFTPSWKENDERHRVKVEVLRKGFKVRARKDFSDLSRQTEVTMLVESVHLFGLPMPGEDPATAAAPLGISFGEPQKGGFGKVVVAVKIEIPYESVTLLPEGGADVAHLELRVAATDDRGGHADVPVIPIEVRREAASQDAVAVFEFEMKLRRRPHRLLFAVHDPASGEILSQRVGVDL